MWNPKPAQSKVSDNPLAFLNTAAPLPPHIAPNIDAAQWARAIIMNAQYKEPRPGAMSTMALVAALNDDNLFAEPEDSNVVKIGDWLPNEAGIISPLIEAHDIYVYPSDGKDGAPTYIDVNIVITGSGAELTLRIGSRRVQAFYLKALARGEWPISHHLARTDWSVKDTYGYRVLPPQ